MAAASALLAGLADAERAFAAGDVVAASALLDGVVSACATLEAAGVRLDAVTLSRAREVHHACAAAALAAGERLAAALEAAGTARRAVQAYAG
jgi:hypothetical protein